MSIYDPSTEKKTYWNITPYPETYVRYPRPLEVFDCKYQPPVPSFEECFPETWNNMMWEKYQQYVWVNL